VLDPLEELTFAAAHTRRVALGMSVLDLPLYNPVLLARQLTTIDVLSAGRLRIGFDTSWSPAEYEAAGVPWKERGKRADEIIQVLKKIWTTDPVEFQVSIIGSPNPSSVPSPCRNRIHRFTWRPMDGLRTAQGKRFASNHIYWILRNKAYVGVLEYNFRERYGAVEPMTIPGFYPAIIDQELFDRVQGKLRLSAANWRNSYANRTTYLLSGLVVCDACGRRYLGTAAKGGKFHYYSCGSYLKGGKETCAARLINKNKLESAVLAKIQEQILTPTNIRSYIQRVMESALKSQDNPSPEQEAVRLALNDVQTRLQRWENALESGELSIEHAAQRIKELHEQRQELLNKKQALDRNRPGVKRISAIPTAHMDAYVAEMQRRLAVKQIGSKREFLQEVLKEVRVRGNNVSLTYKLPLRTSEVRFFTPLRLVGPPGLEPGTNRL
jgi:Luciferase-like monooxygenase/Recombinase zinc beta ribbon domain/Recombinase